MTEISLDRIFVASAQRRVALTSETAGYLVLGVADALAGEGGRVAVGDLRLDSEGRVLVGHVTPCSRASTDEFLRGLLKAALDVAVCLRPALVRLVEQLSCRTELRSHEFARELETALIPVNRAAARRALARLHREVTRLHGLLDKEHGLRESQARHLRAAPTEALPEENRQQAGAPPQEGTAVQGKRTACEVLSKRESRCASASASIQTGSDALARAANEGRAERGLPERTPKSTQGDATEVELHRPERTLALPNVKRRSASPAQVMIGSVSELTLPASTGVERCLLHDPKGPTPELPRSTSSVEQTAALPMSASPNAASKSGTDAFLGATFERTLALPLKARQREDVDPLTDRCGTQSLVVPSQLPTAPEHALIDSLERTMALPI
ncbi:MAG TPA: hypothetical protein VKP30_15890, partial [Polyangiaceae bacterium]|nr:hypothetical protein [Polyangiaceae bacterium]